MLKFLTRPALLVLLLLATAAQASPYQGFYDTFVKRQDTGFGNDRVQVVHFFSYSCKECRAFEAQFRAWQEQKGEQKKVVFQRIPSTFVIDGSKQARIFYTAEELKGKPDLHDGLYAKIQNGQLVLDQNDFLANFLGSRLHMDPFRVEIAMDSIAVNAAVMYAEEVSTRYQANILPMFVVNGRYRVSLKQAGSPEKLLEILDYLIAKELKEYRYQAW